MATGRRERGARTLRASLAAVAMSTLASGGVARSADAGRDGGLSHDPTFFRIDVDLLRMRPDRSRSVGATLCALRTAPGDDRYASARFACDPGRR